MKKTAQDERYYRTSSLATASFLFAKGFELANIDKTENPKRALFVFPNSPELDIQQHIFNYSSDDSPDLLISARTLFTAIKQLKNALYQEHFQ